MVRIAVFDSGLGSMSIINSIRNQFKCSIVYFADTRNFPYGKKSIKEIRDITLESISLIERRFKPEIIIVGSNTLSLTLSTHSKNIVRVLPPINEALKLTKSKSIAVLATESIVNSKLLDDYIKKFNTQNIKVTKINISPLVELVELGKFFSDPKLCKQTIKQTLCSEFLKNNVDVATLSSTHLPFLLFHLNDLFPNVHFLDPSLSLAKKLKKKYFKTNQRNSLQIFTSGNIKELEKKLSHLQIKNKISTLTIE